jgi:hypothetical protein
MASTRNDVQELATIVYDEQSLTQSYAVVANGVEVFRHATYAWCERFVAWHGYTLLSEQEVAQAELEEYIEQKEVISGEIQIDAEEDCFGTLFRVWKGYRFLGSYYQALDDTWVARVAKPDGDRLQILNNSEQAYLYIIASWL